MSRDMWRIECLGFPVLSETCPTMVGRGKPLCGRPCRHSSKVSGHFRKIFSLTTALSDMFTPRDFAPSVGKNPVVVYIVRMNRETPVSSEINGAEAFLA